MLGLVLLSMVVSSQAFPSFTSGLEAACSSCDGIPEHDSVVPQQSYNPLDVLYEIDEDGSFIHIKISSDRPFRGFMIKPSSAGFFGLGENTTLLHCDDGLDALTHKNAIDKVSITTMFIRTANEPRWISFRITLVEKFDVFWPPSTLDIYL
ncbi:putative ferric-chelate reductase 1 [Branchiostoma floridae]|uniref:Ferric-chelate reductase 1 n=1 Tax=Branchiostoma floridae TaxID=7739 RepID=A0A9J7LX21_BRAFL|nr:putative ferric-chelate reductase 1 [Branchiostoma floridae]